MGCWLGAPEGRGEASGCAGDGPHLLPRVADVHLPGFCSSLRPALTDVNAMQISKCYKSVCLRFFPEKLVIKHLPSTLLEEPHLGEKLCLPELCKGAPTGVPMQEAWL